MGDAELVLRNTLEAVGKDLAPEDLRRAVAEWATVVKATIKIVESDPAVGSVCSSRLGICLVPQAQLPVGEKLNAELLRMPPGLPWAYWAQSYERAEEGWTLEMSTKPHRNVREAPNEPKKAQTSSPLERNERSRQRRQRRANPCGP